MTSRKRVRSSLRQLIKSLRKDGYSIGRMTVRRLLKELNYSLKSNRKEDSGRSHPNRDCQFRCIERMKQLYMAAGHPVISVDTKKKVLTGNSKNPGQAWCRQAEMVNVHDGELFSGQVLKGVWLLSQLTIG